VPEISSLEAVKIQARAIIPIAKKLENELGTERAHQLIGDAIADSWADFIATRQEANPHPRSSGGMDFPVEDVIVKDTDDEYAVNMVRCDYADYFRGIGEPEIGALLTCGVDFAVERRMRPEWSFTRSQTLMQGAEYCDFCWKHKGGKT
jgi:hypothetical protein